MACDLELAENVRDVIADGFRTEHQLRGDLWILVTVCNQFQDFAFAVGEFGEA